MKLSVTYAGLGLFSIFAPFIGFTELLTDVLLVTAGMSTLRPAGQLRYMRCLIIRGPAHYLITLIRER